MVTPDKAVPNIATLCAVKPVLRIFLWHSPCEPAISLPMTQA
jgi:hypothetical protein